MKNAPRFARKASAAVPAALPSQVLEASRRICSDMGDSAAAFEAMKHDVLATPPELLADLLAALSRPRLTRGAFLSHHAPAKECNP